MSIFWYIGCVVLIIVGILGMIKFVMHMYNIGRNDILIELHEANEISDKTFIEYKNKNQ
jgi:hypothetical protein